MSILLFVIAFFELFQSQSVTCRENITDCGLSCVPSSTECILHCDTPIPLSSQSPCSIGTLQTNPNQSITIHCSMGYCRNIQIDASLSNSLNIISTGGGPATYTNVRTQCPINGDCNLICTDGCGEFNEIQAINSKSLSVTVIGDSLFAEGKIFCPSTPQSTCQFTCDGNACERVTVDAISSSSLVMTGANKAMKSSSILCPIASPCTINCDEACSHATIDARQSSTLEINLPRLQQSISQVSVYCPAQKTMHGPADTCVINADSGVGPAIDDWRFYTLEGYHDLWIRCLDNYPQNCMSSTTPTVFCGVGYWLSCRVNYHTGLKTYDVSPHYFATPENWCIPDSVNPPNQIIRRDCGLQRLQTYSPSFAPSTNPSNNPTVKPTANPSSSPIFV